jgi:serine/threonine-protein kinase
MQPATGPDRWRRLEELFQAACELDPAERAGWLDQACAGDRQLQQQLESLLGAAEASVGFLQKPIEAAAGRLAGTFTFAPGERIGPWRITRPLGEGGMGSVFLAARDDEQYEQRVAIKVVHAAFGPSETMRLRFRTERQILASLQHSNIARLLDGGVTEGGAPYLVMEYVDGLPVTRYCLHQRLALPARLRLFRSICDAVEYAHKNLVVHRDIKPANILVTSDGTPKLLDFGIAKLLDTSANIAGTAPQTERLLTPDYASPEQILGQQVTTATDVYGLGVLLYELLAGTRPFHVNPQNPLEGARMICESDPAPPSACAAREPAAAAAPARILRGDLDHITLLAMRKEPARRYASVAQLAADIDAYLEGYPVRAGAGHRRYRLGKFLSRHKAAVAVSAAFVLALLGFSGGMALLARRARREQTIADQQARFLAGVFNAATPEVALGKTITARDLLDRAAERIHRDLVQDPEVQAALLEDIAGAYNSLGLYAEARPLAESAYALHARLFGADHPKTADALELAAAIDREQARFSIAESRFRDLIAIRRLTAGPNSVLFARALSDYGETLYDDEKPAEAEAPLRQALAIYNRAAPDEGAQPRNFLALALERKAGFAEAASLLREATEISRRVDGPESPEYAISLHNLGSDLIDLGDMPGAEKMLREVLAIRRKVLGSGHSDLLMTLNNLGFVLLDKGDGRGAEPLLREVLETGLPRLGPDHPSIATYRVNWARALEATGDFDSAATEYHTALAVVSSREPGGRRFAAIHYYLAELAFDRGDYAASERLAREALDLYRRLYGERNPVVAGALIDLAEARLYQGGATESVLLLREALEIREHNFQPGHAGILFAQVRLGEALIVAGRAPEAETLLRQTVAAARASRFLLWPWRTAEAESALAACLQTLGQPTEAVRWNELASAGLRTHPRPAFREDATTRLRKLTSGPRG